MYPEEDRPRSQIIFLHLYTHFASTQGSFQAPRSLFLSNFLPPFDIPSYLTTLLSSSFLPFLYIPLPAGSSRAPSFYQQKHHKTVILRPVCSTLCSCTFLGSQELCQFSLPVNEDWFEGRCKGRTGIFPSAFVQQPSTEHPEK